jgi:diguanylate cyclase (GGDEF)-like protein
MSALAGIEPRGPGAQATRALAVLGLAGGALAILTALTPPTATGSDSLVAIAGLISAAVGLFLLLPHRDLPGPALWLVVALGTCVITLTTHEGGSIGTGTADNEMLYVWVCLYSFYFLSFPAALGELAVVGAAYAWLLSGEGVPFDEATTRWVVTVGSLLVAGLMIATLRGSLDRLFSELTNRARLDGLTGLLNRRAIEERAEAEFARSRRYGAPVAMLVADVDGLKTVNDTLGHHAGDQILLRIAGVLELETREIDAVGRLGGDEFAVLLPGATLLAARAVGERLRLAVKRSASDARLQITLSVGAAVGPVAGHQLEDLWQVADRAMYEAKRAGGDQVAVAPPAAQQPVSALGGAAALVEP